MPYQSIFLFILIVLSGCMSPLTDRMDETNGKIDDTNKKMGEMGDGMNQSIHLLESMENKTELATAVKLFLDTSNEETARIRALHGFFELADIEKALFQYIGTPRPIYSHKYGPVYDYSVTRNHRERFSFKNVTYVGPATVYHEDTFDSDYYVKMIRPVSEEFYEVLAAAVADALEQIRNGFTAAKNAEDVALSRKRAFRILYVAPAIYGGLRLPAVKADRKVSTKALRDAQQNFLKSEQERVWLAQELKGLLELVGLAAEIPVLAALSEESLEVELDWK